MRARRFLGSLIATTLAAGTLGLVATASPASAATGGTKIVSAASGKPWIFRSSGSQPGAAATGDTISFYIDVQSTTAGISDPYAGTVKVERQLAGSSKWTTVATSTGAYLYDSSKAVANATYRAVYSGGTSGSTTWTSSSDSKTVKVQRKLSIDGISGQRAGLKGKVSPKFKGKVLVLKKNGKKWTRFKAIRTNSQSRFVVYLPAPSKGKYFWKLQIAKSKTFTTTSSGVYYTTKY